MQTNAIWQTLKQTVQEWLDDDASVLAAALAFYTAISVAPLLVIIIGVAGIFVSQSQAADQLLQQLTSAIGAEGAQFLETTLANAAQPSATSIAGIISFGTLLWGSTNVFAQLQNSLNKIWNAPEKEGSGIFATLKDRLLSFGMVLGIAFLLLVSLIISSALSAASNIIGGGNTTILWQSLNFVISLGVITLLFAAIFKVLPDVDIQWRNVWIGAAVTALLFTIGKYLLGLYLGNAGSAYGAAGSLMAFLLWVYYSAQIVFFGAEFTQVYTRRHPADGTERPARDQGTTTKETTAAAS